MRCLSILGRAAIVGLTTESYWHCFPRPELINKEAEIVGVSDHLAAELPPLMQLSARTGEAPFPARDTPALVTISTQRRSTTCPSLRSTIQSTISGVVVVPGGREQTCIAEAHRGDGRRFSLCTPIKS